MIDPAREADNFVDWCSEHRGMIGLAAGGSIGVLVALVILASRPAAPLEVQGPPLPTTPPPFDKITTTVCRPDLDGSVCIVRESFELRIR